MVTLVTLEVALLCTMTSGNSHNKSLSLFLCRHIQSIYGFNYKIYMQNNWIVMTPCTQCIYCLLEVYRRFDWLIGTADIDCYGIGIQQILQWILSL